MSKPRTASKRTRRKRPKRWWKRLRWRRILMLGVALFVVPFFGWVAVLYAFGHIPEPNEIARAQSVIVVDRDGRSVGRIHGGADRINVPLKDMPKTLQQAVIATEDRRFYTHPGVRVSSIVRAALSNLFGKGRQGGSTITQQYVKNAFVGNERSIFRKVKEAVVALKLERERSKDEILELYLNTIYLGRGAYGCEAAARTYFGKHCKQLITSESALLAGIIRAPEQYDPSREPEAARDRRNIVLSFMVRDRHITQRQADRAKGFPVRALARASGGIAPHFIEELRAQLEQRYGARDLYSGRIARVVSTLDLDMQQAAEQAVRETYPGSGYGVVGEGRGKGKRVEAALVSLDPHTGQVRALVGARDFAKTQLNLAVRAHRQPGSTFKPAVLAEWFDQGRSVRETFDGGSPKELAGKRISNYDGRGYGKVTVEQATWQSINTVYAQMILKEGASRAVEMAHDLGVTSKLVPQIGLTLGDQEVTPIELAGMYATLAARGERHSPSMILRVIDRGGTTVFRARDVSGPGVKRDVADAVNYVLQGVMQNGTGRPAAIGRPAAGKTGTTEEHNDAWFAGYTPEIVTVVWNGVPRAFLPLLDVTGRINGSDRTISAMFGGSFPAAIWKRFMTEAVKELPATAFPKPKLITPSPTASPSATPSPTGPLPTKKPSVDVTLPPDKSPSPSPKKSSTPAPSPLGGGA